MIPFPRIQIHQQYARIGIESQLGQYDIKRGYAELNVKSTPAVLSIEQKGPEMEIDATRLWEAFHGGVGVTFANRIYSQMPQIMQQNILHMVEKGNRMAALENKENPLPDIAYEEAFGGKPKLQIFGAASLDNIDIQFQTFKPDVQFQPGDVEVDVQQHKPEIDYIRGKVNIYMQQYASVTVTPPALDNRI
jgi:hypothetical protein